MNRYIPSETPADIQSVAYVRQNPWKKCPNRAFLLPNNKLHIPWAHDYEKVQHYRVTGELTERWAKFVAELPIDSIVYVPNENWGNLVRIKSETKTGVLRNMYIVRNSKTCQHTYIDGTCETCRASIVEVTNGSPLPYIEKGHIIEPFWSVYRDIEIVGSVPYGTVAENVTVRKSDLARVDSAGRKLQHWRLQE